MFGCQRHFLRKMQVSNAELEMAILSSIISFFSIFCFILKNDLPKDTRVYEVQHEFHISRKKCTLCDFVCEHVQYDEYLKSSFFW